jgi:hypothetical protein
MATDPNGAVNRGRGRGGGVGVGPGLRPVKRHVHGAPRDVAGDGDEQEGEHLDERERERARAHSPARPAACMMNDDARGGGVSGFALTMDGRSGWESSGRSIFGAYL